MCLAGRLVDPEPGAGIKKSILGQDREGVSEHQVDTYRRIHRIDLKQSKLASEESC